jgi:hypothetical protein
VLLASIVTAVVLGVTVIFAIAGYLIDLSERHFVKKHGEEER